jgi:hypothetical protein
MQTLTCTLPFKGSRNYVTGADLALAAQVAARDYDINALEGSFQISFYQIINQQCRITLLKKEELVETQSSKPAVVFKFIYTGKELHGRIDTIDEPIIERLPYDEDLLINACQLNKEDGKDCVSIFSAVETKFTSFEVLVSMTKYLHQETLPIEAESKQQWIFTRLDLKRLLKLEDILPMKVELVQNMNQRLTRSRIQVNQQYMGDIYFSRVEVKS